MQNFGKKLIEDRYTMYQRPKRSYGQSKTVTTIDGASKQPEELTEVLNVISQVLFVD